MTLIRDGTEIVSFIFDICHLIHVSHKVSNTSVYLKICESVRKWKVWFFFAAVENWISYTDKALIFVIKTIEETEGKVKCIMRILHLIECGCVCRSKNDEKHLGCPNEVTTFWSEMVSKIQDIVSDNHYVKVCEIDRVINISDEHVFNIVHEYLGGRKLSARWVQN